jgi:transcriptional regulator with XRE-family HTH domain
LGVQLEDIKLRFGKVVRELRKQKGYSQEKLAMEAGLDRTYIGGLERGERNVSLINLEKISSALKISLANLFDKIN